MPPSSPRDGFDGGCEWDVDALRQDAVMNDKVATLVLTYSTQQHVILEAVAFGSFLRDAESMVAGTEPRLLTSAPDLPPPREPPRSLEA